MRYEKLPSCISRAEAPLGIVVMKCSQEGRDYPINSTAPTQITIKATFDQKAKVIRFSGLAARAVKGSLRLSPRRLDGRALGECSNDFNAGSLHSGAQLQCCVACK